MADIDAPRILVQVGRFGTVGLTTTALHVVAAAIAHLSGLAPTAANAVGFFCAFAFGYLSHFHWTFRGLAEHRSALGRFLAMSLAAFVLQQAIVVTTTQTFDLPFSAALAVVVLVMPVLTFLAARYWAFSSAR